MRKWTSQKKTKSKRVGSQGAGLFITLEGGEGAGKSSLMTRLESELRKQGREMLATREPGGTSLGEQIREWLLKPSSQEPISGQAELCLFLAARAQHIQERILPALEKGMIVLCDRFNDSTIAYQGVGRGLGVEAVETLCKIVCEGIQPELTFYLDVDPRTGLERSRRTIKEAIAGELDRIESETLRFHQTIREAFLLRAKQDPNRIQVVNAHQSPEQVFHRVLNLILERVG